MSVTAIEALEKRKAKKNYDCDFIIPKEQLDKIINSAKNTLLTYDFQNIFIVVSNQENLA